MDDLDYIIDAVTEETKPEGCPSFLCYTEEERQEILKRQREKNAQRKLDLLEGKE